MSALTCGCDPQALWICEAHRMAVRVLLGDNEEPDTLQRFKDRLVAEDQMKDTEKPSTSARRPDEAFTPAEWKAAALHATTERMDHARTHARTLARIAAILATFYHAELSMSSVQPLLALALELNPDLMETRR